MFRPLLLCTLLLSTACTWVALDPEADAVLVLPAERLAPDCESLGKVKVSVLEKVGVLERHDDEVIEDLNVLARNHAAKQQGDTAVARGPVVDGTREYEIYRCTGQAADANDDAATDASSDRNRNVEVLPYDGGN